MLACAGNGRPNKGRDGGYSQWARTKKLKAFNHHFNVKPVKVHREGAKIIVNGQIYHHPSMRLDDQVYYRIVKNGDCVLEIQRDINRGGLAPIAAPIVAAADNTAYRRAYSAAKA